MANSKNHKLSDHELLQLEKARLRKVIAGQEEKLKGHVQNLQQNYFNMTLHSVLPFGESAREQIISGLHLLNDTVLPEVLGVSFGKGKESWRGNLVKAVQAILIAISFSIFRKLFAKRKKPTPPAGPQ